LAILGGPEGAGSSYALGQTIERLASASDGLASSADAIISTYRELDSHLPTASRALQVVQSRLEHLDAMCRSSERSSSDTRLRLDEAIRAFDQYTLEHKTAA
jgi:hypothetical protein